MPDIIQSMWIGPRLTAMEQMCIKSYLHHGHPFHLYVYQDTADVPDGTVIMDANKIVDGSRVFTYEGSGFGRKSYAGFADVFRYRLLLERGSWWVDTDSICLKPFDFVTEFVFSSEVGNPIHVNCGNLKAPAGSEIYQWLVANSENVNTQMVWGAIGPALMKRAVEQFGFQQYVKLPEVFCPVPYDWTCKNLLNGQVGWNLTPASYAVHLWNEAWRAQGKDKDKTYHPDCFYEELKRRYGVKGNGLPYTPEVIPPQTIPIPTPTIPIPVVPVGRRCNRHNTPSCVVCIRNGWQFAPVTPRLPISPQPVTRNFRINAAQRALFQIKKPK